MASLRAFLVVASAIPILGCDSSQGVLATHDAQPLDVLGEARAVTAPLTADQIVGGQPDSVTAFCTALVAPDGRPESYGQAEGFYNEAQQIIQSQVAGTSADAASLERATWLTCSARFGFNDPTDELRSWNEHGLGSALLLLGKSTQQADILKVSLLASLSAANSFAPFSEGWGWSQYNVGRTSTELWWLEQAQPNLDKAKDALRYVADSSTPASAYAREEYNLLIN
jgi:hypothetical protein